MQAVADAHAAAMVDAHPSRSGRSVQQGVEDRPVGDGVRPIAHPLRLAVRAGDRAGIEMVAPDDDWGRQLA